MPDYILEPIDTDPDSIKQEFTDYIQTYYPNWQANSGQLDDLVASFVSLKMAVIADMASRVMRGIYTYFGSSIVNIKPIAAVNAQVATTWTAIDTASHTIDAGTPFGIRDALGDLQSFTVDADTTFSGGSVTNVVATATEAGAQANNLSGNLELNEQNDWLQVATTVAPSSGGTDGEDEETFLSRLTANLGLMAPRPILARDFALMARNIAGVERAAAIDNWLPGTNEQQTITHTATAGAFSTTIEAATSGSIVWNATAAQVKAALEAATSIEVGDVAVTGGPLGTAPVTVTFTGRFANSNRAQMVASANTLSGGGGSASLAFATTVGGVAPNTAAERGVVVTAIDSSGLALSPTKKAELDTYLQGLREQSFIVNVIDPAYTTVDVTAACIKHPNADAADVDSRATSAVQDFLNSAQWGIPYWPPDARGWDVKTALRAQDFYTVLNNVDGLDYVSSLSFSNGAGATQDASDKTLLGTFPLVIAGNIAITVT